MAVHRIVCGVAAVLAVTGVALGVLRAQATPASAPWSHPRTPWGDPDLEGVWTSDNNFAIPLERRPEVADKEFLDGDDLEAELARRARLIAAIADGGAVGAGPSHWYENLTARSRRSSLIVDPRNGRLPALTEEARARASAERAARAGRGPADSWEDMSLWDRCITVGLPAVMFPTGYNNNIQILQAPGYVTITHEMMHDTRIVPLDPSTSSGSPRAQSRGDQRPHLSPRIRNYMGDSRGRWEGDTLVIDVTNFHPKTNYRGSRDTLHLIERYTRTGVDRLRYEVTIDDPRTFERPWRAVLDLAPQNDIYEYDCHEGNRGLENILRAARVEEARTAERVPAPPQPAPTMNFFLTSKGRGFGANLGGLRGADAHCQQLADSVGAGQRTWRAYLSAPATSDQPAVDARDRIGRGPWFNAKGELIAAGVTELHDGPNELGATHTLTEKGTIVAPGRHDVLTGSNPDGTLMTGRGDTTCGGWTSLASGRAMLGHHNRSGGGERPTSWNSAHLSRGCSQAALRASLGDGLIYCFAAD